MIDWNAWKDKIHALQVERGAWRCGACNALDVPNDCDHCRGTGKRHVVAEIVCHVHADLSEAWSLCIKGDLPYYSHRVGGHLATAALRVLDLAGYYRESVGRVLPRTGARDIPVLFIDAYHSANLGIDTGEVDYCLTDLVAIAGRLDIDLEAAMTARFEKIKNGGEL